MVSYNQVIKNTLGVEEIPKAKGNYYLKNQSFILNVDERDLDIFQKLYYISPPKLNETKGQSKASGNSEVAIYWLYKHQENQVYVKDCRGGSNPDLQIHESFSEIKAYEKHNKQTPIGRFGADKINLNLLNLIFSFNILLSPLNLDTKSKVISSTNFNGKELFKAFQSIFNERYDLPKVIQDNIGFLLDNLDNPTTPEQATRNMILKILTEKLLVKPGDREYLCIVTSKGVIHFYYIDFNKLFNVEVDKLIKAFSINQSFIYLNFHSVFA